MPAKSSGSVNDVVPGRCSVESLRLVSISKPLPHLLVLMLLLAKLRSRLARHMLGRKTIHPSIRRGHVASDVGCNLRGASGNTCCPVGDQPQGEGLCCI